MEALAGLGGRLGTILVWFINSGRRKVGFQPTVDFPHVQDVTSAPEALTPAAEALQRGRLYSGETI